MIVWLTGLSGAGKSTVGAVVYETLKAQTPHTVFLDGDILREVWGDSLGHDIEGRRKNAERFTRLCAMLDQQGINVIAAILSIFPEGRQRNRTLFSSYFEIFIDTPFDEVVRRDSKGLYRKALAGEVKNVVGVDIPFPRDETWDMIIAGDEAAKPAEIIAARIVAKVREKGWQ